MKAPTKLATYESYLRERVAAAKPHWIPATVLYREIAERGYAGEYESTARVSTRFETGGTD